MYVLTLIAAIFTTAVGVAGLVAPRRVSAAIGLSLEGARGIKAGLSQFRATLGGFFIAVGVTAIVIGPGAGLVVGIGWLGTAAARAVSVIVDRNASAANLIELALEAVVGVLFVLGYVLS